LFCPDCGRYSTDSDHFCTICGFPLEKLRQTLDNEKKAELGWAEKIVGKPDVKSVEPPDPPLISYATGKETPRQKKEEEQESFKCERCGIKTGVGTMCPNCGETLPSLIDNDPYLSLVLKNFFRMILAPRHYATKFPYPITGGTLQPLLWPGVFAAIFVLTLPFARSEQWLERGDPTQPLLPAFVGIPLYVLGTPVLVYLSTGLIYLISKLLGGTASYRRTARVFSGGLIIIFIYGIVRNIFTFLFYLGTPRIHRLVPPEIDIRIIKELSQSVERALLVFFLAFIGWQFMWAFGGLNRLSWWKTLILFLASYVAVLWWLWLYTMVLLPLNLGGLL